MTPSVHHQHVCGLRQLHKQDSQVCHASTYASANCPMLAESFPTCAQRSSEIALPCSRQPNISPAFSTSPPDAGSRRFSTASRSSVCALHATALLLLLALLLAGSDGRERKPSRLHPAIGRCAGHTELQARVRASCRAMASRQAAKPKPCSTFHDTTSHRCEENTRFD